MPVLKIQGFSGAIPVTGDRALEENYAVESINTWLYGQELRGVRAPKLLENINPTTRRVLRVPERTVGGDPAYPDIVPPPSYLGDSAWVQFTEHDVDIVKGQLVEDKYERYYFCSAEKGPRFNTYARMKEGLTPYKLGVRGPAFDYDGEGSHPSTPTIISITPLMKSDDIYEIEFKISATGTTAYTNPGGTGNRTSLITIGGTTQFDFGGGTSNALGNHLFNGNLTEAGFKFSDLTAAGNTIQFDFATTKIIDQFRWKQATELTYGKWTFERSADASAWVALGTITLGGAKEQAYGFSNTTAARYYRLKQEVGSATIMTTCSYVYTWVNEFGEESAPSLPVLGSGDANGVWTIGNITIPPDLGVDYPDYTKKYLYRTLSGGSSNFYRVAEVPLNDLTYVDDRHVLSDVVLTNNLALESTYWQPPPENLQGWVAMPNGFLIAFDKPVDDDNVDPLKRVKVKGNNIYMCEAYHFHAWPPQFKYATETTIVGLGVVGQTCVVCTQGYPATVTGIKPSSCSFTKARSGEPCLSRGGIVSSPQGVVYPSQNGLVLVGAGGISNVTEQVITREDWLKGFAPQYLRAVRYQNGYLALRMFPTGAVPPRSGFYVDPTSLRVALTEFSDFGDVLNFDVDFWSGEVFLIKSGQIYQWDPPPDPPDDMTFMPVRWKSKEFQFPYPENFGAYAIHWDDDRYSDDPWASGVLPVGEKVRFTVYADRRKAYEQTVAKNGKPIRLPSGFKADIWQFEIRARVPVYSLHVASTMKELRAV